MMGIVVWDYKGEDGHSHGDRKEVFGKQMFAWPGKDNRSQREILTNFPRFFPTYYTKLIP